MSESTERYEPHFPDSSLESIDAFDAYARDLLGEHGERCDHAIETYRSRVPEDCQDSALGLLTEAEYLWFSRWFLEIAEPPSIASVADLDKWLRLLVLAAGHLEFATRMQCHSRAKPGFLTRLIEMEQPYHIDPKFSFLPLLSAVRKRGPLDPKLLLHYAGCFWFDEPFPEPEEFFDWLRRLATADLELDDFQFDHITDMAFAACLELMEPVPPLPPKPETAREFKYAMWQLIAFIRPHIGHAAQAETTGEQVSTSNQADEPLATQPVTTPRKSSNDERDEWMAAKEDEDYTHDEISVMLREMNTQRKKDGKRPWIPLQDRRSVQAAIKRYRERKNCDD